MKFLGDIDTSNLLLLDVKYAKPRAENNYEDYAMILLKNVVTGEKKVVNIKNPEMDIYFTKPEYRDHDEYNLSAVEAKKTYSKRVKIKNLSKAIAKEAGGKWEAYHKQCMEQGKYRATSNLHHYNYVFGSDIPPVDYFWTMWNIHYHNNHIQAHFDKLFLDIEVDGIETKGLPLNGVAPINAVSLTDAKTKTGYQFLLRKGVRDNPLIAEFEQNIDEYYKLCHETFDEEFPGFTYKVYMFDDEATMIKGVFHLIKTLDRDFCTIWNMGYDIPYIKDRCYELGLDPIEIMTSDDFAIRELFYWADKKTGIVVEKKDSLTMSSRTVFQDAMLIYGKLRKGRGVIPSLRLNAIAATELESQKVDYSEIANIKTLPYINYVLFALYSMKDTLLMYGIEMKTEDLDTVYARAISTGTGYKSLFSPTKFLKNRYYLDCFKDGYIAGNNVNMDYSRDYNEDADSQADKKKFDGAVVGDSQLNEHVGVKIFGKPSKYVYKYVVDMDFSSMYPWTIDTFNVSPHTMIGKLLVDKHYFKGEVRDGDMEDEDLKFEPGKEFVENMLAEDMIKMGENWFNLPSVADMLEELEDVKPQIKNVMKLDMVNVYPDEEIFVGCED